MATSGVIDDRRKLDKILKQLKQMGGGQVTIGWHGDKKAYRTKEEGGDEPITNPQLAAVHEFGTKDGHVPARPTMRPTVDAKQEEYFRQIQSWAGQVIDGTMDPKRLFNLVGLMVAKDIKAAIVNFTGDPELADSTKLAKLKRSGLTGKKAKAFAEGDGNPLVDSAQMKNSITYEVKMNK